MYRERFTVMPSEASCTGEIKIRALLNRLQDAASMAVADLEGSPGDMIQRGYAWVLLRYDIDVKTRLPAMDESVVVETRHTINDGFHTLRVFRVFKSDNEAETLVLAKTSWVLIDLAAGRPVRAVQRVPEVFSDVADDPPIDPEFASIPKLSGPDLKDAPFTCERDFLVRFHDLDANGHVNNAVYFEWIYEATPLDLLGWGVRNMQAEFRISAKLGDRVRVRIKKPSHADMFAYDIIHSENSDGKHALARFYAEWLPLGGARS